MCKKLEPYLCFQCFQKSLIESSFYVLLLKWANITFSLRIWKKGRIHVTTALIFSPLNNFKVITSKLLTLLPRQKCYFRSFIRVSNLFWTRYSTCKAIVFKIKRGGMHFNLKCYRFSQCPWIALNSTPGVSVSTTHIVLPHLQSVWLVTIVGRRLGFWLKCSVQ